MPLALTLKIAVVPAVFVMLCGWEMIPGGKLVMVSIAVGVLVTAPEPLTTTSYPAASDADTPDNDNADVVVPETFPPFDKFELFFRHWYASGPFPSAKTVNPATVPVAFVRLCGG